MAITYYMLQISPFLFFIILIVLGAFFGAVSTLLFRRFQKFKVLRSHNEVIGFFFLAIASFYALLLSFIVLVVWDQLNETTGNVSKEGSSAMGLYRDIKYYPDVIESKKMMKVYLDFVLNVVDDEFPKMEKMQISLKTRTSFNNVFFTMERLNPKNTKQLQLVGEMFHHLNELAIYRGLRITSMETEIYPPMWMPMILGALITIFCSLLLDIENKLIHVLLNAFLGAFIGMFFFIIIILDHPYAGSLGLKPTSYMDIFTMEKRDFVSNDVHTYS